MSGYSKEWGAENGCFCATGLCPNQTNPAVRVVSVAAPLGTYVVLKGETFTMSVSGYRIFRPSKLCVDHRIARYFEVTRLLLGKHVWFPTLDTSNAPEKREGLPCSSLPPIPSNDLTKDQLERVYPPVFEPFRTLNQGERFELVVRNLGKKPHFFSALLYVAAVNA